MSDAGTQQTSQGVAFRGWFDDLRLLFRRHRLGALLGVALVAVLLGFAIGRATAPGTQQAARHAVEVHVFPLVLDADSIWTSGVGEADPVSAAVIALSRDGDASLIEANRDRWLAAYDAAIVQMAGLDLPPAARPVQRQFMAAATLSQDAVAVLARAAAAEDAEVRDQLVMEVGRLRERSEQLTQSARASTADLDGGRTDVAPLPDVLGAGDA